MTPDWIAAILRANLAADVAILLVLALRRPVRKQLGAELAYLLWAIPPLAAAAVLFPAARAAPAIAPSTPSETMAAVPAVHEMATSAAHWIAGAAPTLPSQDPWLLPIIVWLAGAVLGLGLLLAFHANFLRLAARGLAGPATTGFLRMRLVVPANFEHRFTAQQREVILAHEAAHIERGDPRINVVLALVQCLFWFNPLLHLAAYWLRLDQEFACDAAVIARRPAARRLYAQAMLGTQLTRTPLPFGCYWPARSPHPLEERIALLQRRRPGRTRARNGSLLIILAGVGTAYGAWASQPARPALQRAFPALAAPLVSTTDAAPAASPKPLATPSRLTAAHPDPARDEDLVEAARKAFAADGYPALQDHAAALRAVLARAPLAFPSVARKGEAVIVRTDAADFPQRSFWISLQDAATPQGAARPIRRAPNTYPDASLLLSGYEASTGRTAAADAALDRGLALQPDNPRLAAAKAQNLARQGRDAQALPLYDLALRGDGLHSKADRARLLIGQAEALARLGRLDEADRAYAEAMTVQPAGPETLDAIADLARRRADRQG